MEYFTAVIITTILLRSMKLTLIPFVEIIWKLQLQSALLPNEYSLPFNNSLNSQMPWKWYAGVLLNCDWSTICAKCDSAQMIFHNKSSNDINLSQRGSVTGKMPQIPNKDTMATLQIISEQLLCIPPLEACTLISLLYI